MQLFNRDRFSSASSYATYQATIVAHHLLPLFRRRQILLDQPILDVGCANGGSAITLAAALSAPVTGIDVLEDCIAAARKEAAAANVLARFYVADLLNDEIPCGPYGLILMHDVIEHLPQPEVALRRLRPHLKADGVLYVSFPPWRGPYAGHQHNATSALRFMPYLHVMAPSLFLKLLLRWEPESEEWLMDVGSVIENRLSMHRFERMIRRTGWKITYMKSYFLRPELLRMGLPKVPNGWIGRLPWIGECLTTGCEYLLAPS
jgi:2-polyprenyl-3-methyl-5-hydroxy-6-metoxy-1,4-benzoquinol methylase